MWTGLYGQTTYGAMRSIEYRIYKNATVTVLTYVFQENVGAPCGTESNALV